ncbi:MAG: CBS domain-containing protein, partial [Methanoregula sp.]
MDKKKVKDYMTYDVVSVDLHGTVEAVIEKIQQTKHDGFPVLDKDEVVGYIAARDLLFVKPGETIAQAMS